MRNVIISFALVTTLTLAMPLHAAAGLVDSPAPNLDGQPARVLYYVPGVTKNNGIETVFICTSLDGGAGTITVGVEVFDPNSGSALNNVGAGDGAESIPAGGTVTIATGTTLGFHEDEAMMGLPPNVKGGSARILSTSKRLACEAFLVEEVGSPPALIAPLKVISRKQNGD
jgi:hypothetical protein